MPYCTSYNWLRPCDVYMRQNIIHKQDKDWKCHFDSAPYRYYTKTAVTNVLFILQLMFIPYLRVYHVEKYVIHHHVLLPGGSGSENADLKFHFFKKAEEVRYERKTPARQVVRVGRSLAGIRRRNQIQIQIQIQKYSIASCLTISSVHNNSQWYNTSSTFDPNWIYNSDIVSRKHRMSTLYLGLQFKSK